MTVSISAPDQDIRTAALAWLGSEHPDMGDTIYLSMFEDFCYDGFDFETTAESILSAALGNTDDVEPLFEPISGVELFLDLVAGGDGTIDGTRFILDPGNGGVNLASGYQEIKGLTDDRNATGPDAVVAVLTNAAREWNRLLTAYRAMTVALPPGAVGSAG